MKNPKAFEYIGDVITRATEAFVQPATANLISELQVLTLTGVTLYLTLTGYAITTGTIQSPFWTFVKQSMKIIIIAFVALTADGYLHGVVEAINGLESGLSQTLSLVQNSDNTALSTYQLLDQSLGRGFDIAQQCCQKADDAGWHLGSALGWLVAALVVGVSTIYIVLLGGTTIIVTKFSLATLFALGPLFIVALMFPVTTRFFESWFAQVMNYVLIIVIMTVVMTFAIKAYDAYINSTNFYNDKEVNPMFVALQVCAVSGILGWIILQAGSLASGLAGGISMAVMDIKQTVAPLASAANVVKGVSNLLNPKVTKRDMQSGMTTTTSRARHITAGNTMLNPAYRQYIMENIGKNWGRSSGGNLKNASS